MNNFFNKINLLICTLLCLVLTSCKIDFEGDLYTSDLLTIAEEGGSINLPMEIKFQVSSCDEDLTDLNNKIST